jgi:hypothetical protein
MHDVGEAELMRASQLSDLKSDVPIVFQGSPELCEAIRAKRTYLERVPILMNFLESHDADLVAKLKRYTMFKIQPYTNDPTATYDSYKRQITDMVLKAEKKEKTTTNLDAERKNINNWQAMIDMEEHRIIILMYHGAPKKKLIPVWE